MNEYTSQVIKRTVKARKEAGFVSQAEIAKELKISRERYAKYETERIIHKELISKFCQLTGITEDWLLSGKKKKLDDPNHIDLNIFDSGFREEGQKLYDELQSKQISHKIDNDLPLSDWERQFLKDRLKGKK